MLNKVLWRRQSLAPLGIVTIVALIGLALSISALMIVAGQIIPALLILAVISLIVAGLVATGVRWLPLLGALYGIGTMIGGFVSQQYLPYHLTHPGEVGFFITSLLMYVFSVIAVYSGIGALVQNYSRAERRAPRWLATSLVGMAGFVLGAFLVSLIIAMTAQVSAVPTSVNGTTTVHMGISTFVQPTATLSKGSKLLLVDDGQFLHILDNGTWVNNTPQSATEPGAPSIQNLNVNGNTVEVGPFNTAGTFHIYCTVHQGMNLTVIVQ